MTLKYEYNTTIPNAQNYGTNLVNININSKTQYSSFENNAQYLVQSEELLKPAKTITGNYCRQELGQVNRE